MAEAIFNMAAVRHLDFLNFNFWSRDCHRGGESTMDLCFASPEEIP